MLCGLRILLHKSSLVICPAVWADVGRESLPKVSFPPGLGGVCPSVSVAVPSFVVSQLRGVSGGIWVVPRWCPGGLVVSQWCLGGRDRKIASDCQC